MLHARSPDSIYQLLPELNTSRQAYRPFVHENSFSCRCGIPLGSYNIYVSDYYHISLFEVPCGRFSLCARPNKHTPERSK